MTPTVQVCPHCGAPLAASRFAAIVVCSFCDATVRIDPSSVPAGKFRQAWAEWNEPPDDARRVSIGSTHWLKERLLARGEISDVYLARRARWPSELVVLKVLRDANDAPLFEQEWRALERLHARSASAGLDLGVRVPAPVIRGTSEHAYRWAGGFLHTFEQVREVHRHGIPPVAAIWVWRRILEVLGALRKCGLVHGAILPHHLLIQRGEHGVRIVGFSCADAPGAPLRAICSGFEDFYPDSKTLSPAMDVAMSARSVSYLLGDGVPPRLADLLRRAGRDGADADPWTLHKEVGELGKALFGPAAFHPIAMT